MRGPIRVLVGWVIVLAAVFVPWPEWAVRMALILTSIVFAHWCLDRIERAEALAQRRAEALEGLCSAARGLVEVIRKGGGV